MTPPRMNSEIQEDQAFIREVLARTATKSKQDALEVLRTGKPWDSKASGANARQVGGSHYEAELQHWDVIEDYGIGYIEGCSSKYVTRARKKNGLQDVEKAVHYIEKLLEIRRPPRGHVPIEVCLQFIAANKLTDLEGAIVVLLLTWTQFKQLERALELTLRLLDITVAAMPGQAAPPDQMTPTGEPL